MTILVTAASGKVGREVLAQLQDRGADLRPGSRRSAIPLNWTDPTTWPAALDGVERVFVIVPGGDDGHRSVLGLGFAVCAFLDLASRSGVTHVVLMTALGMNYAPAEVEQRAVELHLQRSKLKWTILRPNWFFQNLVDGPLHTIAEAGQGTLRLPTSDAAVSFIDTRDIAAVAVEALLGDHTYREYDLTGPQSLTFADVADTCRNSKVLVDDYQPVTASQFRAMVIDLGWHLDYVDTISGLFTTIAAGHAAPVLPDAANILGRPTRRFGEFVQEIR
ncbi:hypothetical protein CH293_26215 [Rhodococcus sp. 14-2470-1b]|uniref:NAD(P)H-binding protein n=1 Tax=Rhodococcus sp. 14-2470-1b TaxID=2023149 RepID=UPI000B9BF063|nr:NAD(P)H-binding protein [Rhodococcus sp. 14-2470-1b]OZF42581.1 hypothetical protein CH293_26215 [Rhodococcus sp. 14-2470-1b]